MKKWCGDKGVRIMEYGERYCFIYPDGEVLSAIWRNTNMDNGII